MSIIMYFGDIAAFFILIFPSLKHKAELLIILTTIFVFFGILTFYYAFKATKKDPTDPSIYLNNSNRQPDWSKYEFYCNIC